MVDLRVQGGGPLTSQVLEGTTPVASPPMTYVQTPAGAIVTVPTSTVTAAVANGSQVIGTVSPTGAPATLQSSETTALQSTGFVGGTVGTTESSGSPWAFLTDLPTWEVAAIVGAVLLLILLLAVL